MALTSVGDLVDVAMRRQARLASAGWTVAPLASFRGFIATPWIGGLRLSRNDAMAGVLARVGSYTAASSCDVLSVDEQRVGVERLAKMLESNTRESLGDDAAARARGAADAARPLLSASDVPAYGDGRLDPHEWVRTPDGRILKTDCAGHDVDHTLVGRQSITWDLASTLVEWAPDTAAEQILLDSFRSAGGIDVSPPVLRFCRLAYAAFRLGLANMCAAAAPDDEKRKRLGDEEGRYRKTLAAHLA